MFDKFFDCLEYNIGEMIVPKQFSKLKVRKDGTLTTETFTIGGRKIPLMHIRQHLLDSQENNNFLRAKTSKEYNTMAIENVISRLKQLEEFEGDLDDDDLRQRLQELETTRYITCWGGTTQQ